MVLGAFLVGCGDDAETPASPDAAADAAAGGDAGDERSKIERSIATSPTHSCALRRSGLYCWGENILGELGNESTEPSESPVEATVAGADIVDMALHTARTCVRRSTGRVSCWGGNDRGQIGDGTRDDSLTPVDAEGIDDAVALAIDDASTCVIHAGDEVSCWGRSKATRPEEGSLTSQRIEGLSGAVELRAGSIGTYCARGGEGWIKCFRFAEGQWTTPAEVEALAGARGLGVTGDNEVCGIVEAGEILCSNLDSGRAVPLSDSAGSVEIVAAGGLAACARNEEQRWHCWNVLPSMLETVGSPALELPVDTTVTEIAISGFRVCALREDGRVACANANDSPPEFMDVSGLPD
jgi:Regulator of chromosome condensation (RCC1) repeat